jgi:D-tagatose-1,6-bisphosphate aldolase subunit GatZ/KbaZ
MLARLDAAPPPLTLLSQYLPRQYEAVREGRISTHTDSLLRDGTVQALRPYLVACAA